MGRTLISPAMPLELPGDRGYLWVFFFGIMPLEPIRTLPLVAFAEPAAFLAFFIIQV